MSGGPIVARHFALLQKPFPAGPPRLEPSHFFQRLRSHSRNDFFKYRFKAKEFKMNSINVHRHFRSLIVGACLGACLIAAGPASSQERNTALQENDKALTSIEGLFSQIEAAKTDGEKDKYADDLERRIQAYAKAMVAAFNAALKQAELANKSQDKQGSTEALKAFEDLAVKHEGQWKELDSRAKKAKPKSGSIWGPALDGIPALGWKMLGQIGDFLISPAEAAIALQVYSACHQSPRNQAACAQALTSGAAQTSAAYANFNACWNSYEGTRPKWWRAFLRGGCALTLTARLA
jgi:hypothetical protein